jgi:prepilin peptidase CpaA
MHTPFFPGPVFGWVYWLVLTALLGYAAYVDHRTMTVPKKLTLSALGLGLAFNLIRGLWLGFRGDEVWSFGIGGPLLGAGDGLAFAAVGLLLGFGLFFVMWLMGVCGGGDVKLFAALGAWVGPNLVIYVLVGTIVVVLVFTVAKIVMGLSAALVRAHPLGSLAVAGRLPAPTPASAGKRGRQRFMAYSLPVALSTTVVLLWVMRVDLHLAPAHTTITHKGEIHGR